MQQQVNCAIIRYEGARKGTVRPMIQRTCIILAIFCSFAAQGCAVILGKNDVPAAQADRQVRVEYVETLRNQASFGAGRFLDAEPSASPATSLQRPVAVAADDFRVYVTDRSPAGRLAVFDRNERSVTFSTGPTPTAISTFTFLDPSAVAVDGTGTIYVADSQQGTVVGMDRKGTPLLFIGRRGELSFPSGLAVDAKRGRLIVADKHAGLVRVFTLRGDALFQIGRSGTPGDIRTPVGVALDPDGTIAVLDAGKNTVHLFDPEGGHTRTFPISTGRQGPSVKPSGIAMDSAGRISVTDSVNNSVLIFERDGSFLQRWGGMGNRQDEFWSPAGIFIDARDTVYIADHMNGRVQVYHYAK